MLFDLIDKILPNQTGLVKGHETKRWFMDLDSILHKAHSALLIMFLSYNVNFTSSALAHNFQTNTSTCCGSGRFQSGFQGKFSLPNVVFSFYAMIW